MHQVNSGNEKCANTNVIFVYLLLFLYLVIRHFRIGTTKLGSVENNNIIIALQIMFVFFDTFYESYLRVII